MAVLPLVTAPDPRLEARSEPVSEVNADIRQLMDDMLETMYEQEGIGLAAVQVGVHKRVLVMDLRDTAERYEEEGADKPEFLGPYFMAIPEIVKNSEEETDFEEGCLSFPGQRAVVSRPSQVTVRYLDYDGKQQEVECDGLLAICVQHEIDHLNGVVFIDHVSKLKHDMIMRRVAKIKKRMSS
jgi:peptide deformylase